MANPRPRLRREAVLRYLIRNSLSQKQLASDARLSEGFFSQVLSGRRSLSARSRGRLLAVLGGGVEDWFVLEEGEADPRDPDGVQPPGPRNC